MYVSVYKLLLSLGGTAHVQDGFPVSYMNADFVLLAHKVCPSLSFSQVGILQLQHD